MPSTGFRRRADLSGVFRISDRSVLVVAADASGPVKDGVGAVGADVDLDPRPDKMGPHRALRDLDLERPVGDAIVMADLPLPLDAQDLVEVDTGNGVKAEPSPAGRTAKRALWAGRWTSRRKAFAASISVMPAGASSPPVRAFPRRFPDHPHPLKMKLDPGVAPAEAVVLHQMRVKVLDGEALIALAMEPPYLLGPVDGNLPSRRSTSPASPPPLSGASSAGTSARSPPKAPLPLPGSAPPIPSGSGCSKTPPCAPPEGLPSGASQPLQKRAGLTGQIVRYLNRTYRVLATTDGEGACPGSDRYETAV